ncbi:unnamed protein product, partial [Hymenolepis diminuta]
MMRISTEERMNLFRRKREHHEVVRRSMKFSMMEKQIALVLDGLKYLSFENVVHLMGVVNLSECSKSHVTNLCGKRPQKETMCRTKSELRNESFTQKVLPL